MTIPAWKNLQMIWDFIPTSDLGTSIDLKSADKELKAVTPEKSKMMVKVAPRHSHGV